jgi:hypothetical protein
MLRVARKGEHGIGIAGAVQILNMMICTKSILKSAQERDVMVIFERCSVT